MKKFPKTLYVKVEGRENDEYFNTYESIDSTVDAGQTERVAVYVLKEVVEAKGSVTVVTAKPIRKRAA